MIHNYFILVTVTLITLTFSTVRAQEKANEEISVFNPIDFSKNISFDGTTLGTVTFPTTFTEQPSFSMERKSLQLPAIALNFENVKTSYINEDYKPSSSYSNYLYCNTNMSSKTIMENMALEYLVDQCFGSFKLIKSKCNSKK
ncbi:MAG TPA: hypothetical protein VLB74_08130 [Flavobacterium sp.]|uniref:hypothetical protein n=1 Tax=Flavobacterium sp. TaxID=239 RepID=UPI002C31DF34|nr:hypothetical protein [Flavobacterium sp.]HSD14602.1 hypothetical protein [Flavobacterium sp.]